MKKVEMQYLNNFERIAELRKDKNLRQVDIANMLGMSQRNYSHIESGEYDFTSRQLIVLAKLFEVSVDYLIGLTDEKKAYPKSQCFKLIIDKQTID